MARNYVTDPYITVCPRYEYAMVIPVWNTIRGHQACYTRYHVQPFCAVCGASAQPRHVRSCKNHRLITLAVFRKCDI